MAAAMRVIREPEKKPTELDVKILLGRCLDDFCEFYRSEEHTSELQSH